MDRKLPSHTSFLPAMATVQELKTQADADAMLEASHGQTVALLKHSIACPISARGQEQFVGLEGKGDPPLYCVVVQYAREASAYIAETLGVEHQTPQVILIRDGRAVHDVAHHRIQLSSLRSTLAELA